MNFDKKGSQLSSKPLKTGVISIKEVEKRGYINCKGGFTHNGYYYSIQVDDAKSGYRSKKGDLPISHFVKIAIFKNNTR